MAAATVLYLNASFLEGPAATAIWLVILLGTVVQISLKLAAFVSVTITVSNDVD